MSKHKRVEFARICGIDRAAVSVNIGRKKIVVDEDGSIDDTNEINKKFLEHCLSKPKKNESDGESPKKGYDDDQRPKKNAASEGKSTPPEGKSHTDEGKNSLYLKDFEVSLQKKEADILQKQTTQQLAEMKLKKMAGRLIDREAAWSIFTQQFKFFSKSFHDGVEGLLTEIVKKSRLSRNDHAEMRKLVIGMINNSVDRAVDDGKKHFSALIQNESK